MRYLENGVQEKYSASYFFDASRFDIQSYFIFFDSSSQYIELEGLMDETAVDFSYVDWDYYTAYTSNIEILSESMFTYLQSFDTVEDFTMSVGQDATNSALKSEILKYLDLLNYNNQLITKRDYYNHGINRAYPFAEFIIIKIKDTDYIAKATLNKFISKDTSSTIIYTLDNETFMSKYLYHFSTYDSDYTSIFLKLIYNIKDYETVNKESIIISSVLYPLILSDSSKLYIDVIIDSTSADLTNKYKLFDLTANEILFLNNKYLSHVKNIIDQTLDISGYHVFDTTYQIEFIDFDTTDELTDYMEGEHIQYDFTQVSYEYFFNIRTIKKLNFQNTFYENSSEFFTQIFSQKTFFGQQNRISNTVSSSAGAFFSTAAKLSSLTYSGSYDVTNNTTISLLSLFNSFRSDTYTLPYDVTILMADVSNKTPFDLDLFIANASDVSNFSGNYVRNGLYIFNESGIRDIMILRADKVSQIDSNTFKIKFVCVLYDDTQAGDVVDDHYHIPSNSYVIQYKYHIYNVIPYLKLNEFSYSNDLNNLMTVHSFSYSTDNPTSYDWNGYNVNI